jgi:transcriptional regulator with XRE-family HTH domain
MEYANRIKAIMKALKLNQSEFAKTLGFSKGVISEFSTGSRKPSKEFMFGILKLGVSLDWFLTGNGEMFITSKIDVPSKPVMTTECEDENVLEVVMLRAELERLKKENFKLTEDIQKIDAECKKLDAKNRAISDELVERLRQLVDTHEQLLVKS